MKLLILLAVAMLYTIPDSVTAGDQLSNSPHASTRSYAQNYKDMVLATCLGNAYKTDSNVATDVGSSISALRDWTYYDLGKSPEAIRQLVNAYLAKDHSNPLVESEIKGVKFSFLKCLDLYHSKEIETQVRQYVQHPNRTYHQDKGR